MSRPVVVVVGGGWAGLAAATRLVQKGFGVTLLERDRELGGRASSFWDESFEEWLDNGLHVFIGAYSSALKLLRSWESVGGISFDDGGVMPWIYPGGRVFRLKLGGRRGRLGAAAGLMSFRGMSMIDRVRSMHFAEALSQMDDVDPENEPTVEALLSQYGIKHGDCGGLWDALTTAVMNAPPHLVGVSPLIGAIREGLLIGESTARIGLPNKPFKQLYLDPAAGFLSSNGVKLKTHTGVKRVLVERSEQLVGVEVDGEKLEADAVILTVSPQDLLRLLPKRLQSHDFFARFRRFEYASIAAVHLGFDRPVLPFRYGFFPGAFTHWVFGRGQPEADGWSRVSVVISSTPHRKEMMSAEIKGLVLDDLRERLTEVKRAEVQAIRAVRTARATVLLKPGSDLLRPPSRTPVDRLYLAGDWCDTGLPATIESAARSGTNAADEVIVRLG